MEWMYLETRHLLQRRSGYNLSGQIEEYDEDFYHSSHGNGLHSSHSTVEGLDVHYKRRKGDYLDDDEDSGHLSDESRVTEIELMGIGTSKNVNGQNSGSQNIAKPLSLSRILANSISGVRNSTRSPRVLSLQPPKSISGSSGAEGVSSNGYHQLMTGSPRSPPSVLGGDNNAADPARRGSNTGPTGAEETVVRSPVLNL